MTRLYWLLWSLYSNECIALMLQRLLVLNWEPRGVCFQWLHVPEGGGAIAMRWQTYAPTTLRRGIPGVSNTQSTHTQGPVYLRLQPGKTCAPTSTSCIIQLWGSGICWHCLFLTTSTSQFMHDSGAFYTKFRNQLTPIHSQCQLSTTTITSTNTFIHRQCG